MRKKIFGSIFLTSFICILLAVSLVFGVMYRQYYIEMKAEVQKQADFVAAGYVLSGEEYLRSLEGGQYRITLIEFDGRVIFDNLADPSAMENHKDRPEVKDAISTGAGESTRFSATVGEQTFYYAMLMPDGVILRLASFTKSVFVSLAACIPFLILAVVITAVLSAIIAKRRTKSIIKPINALNLDDPLQNDVYEEMAPLLTRIEKQHRQIYTHMAELQRMRDEFTAITDNMNEGLILLGKNAVILSINSSACRLFNTDGGCVGKNILTIDRCLSTQHIISEATDGRRAETTVPIKDRIYQLLASPVVTSGQTDGIVLLAFDITEKSHTEQLRREFTANVSHELKTPLQTIMGSAELLANGMVNSDDIPRFVGRIHSEAARLVVLIDDIIRLSQLDENNASEAFEDIDLLDLSHDVADSLRESAESKKITLSVLGEKAVVKGVYQALREIIYNLCDNSIKYNRENGYVKISVSDNSDIVRLTVSDNGIGIPEAHRSRIFERFYRVDKSHSKETGGTGLGLSIVKHAAKLHNASIELESREDEGTKITVVFPK